MRGTLSESYIDQSNPTQATNESHSFTGVISGSSVTLTLDSGANWNGTVSGSGMSLSHAAADGTLSTFRFTKATVADYNNAVAGIRSQAAEAQRQQSQSQAQAAVEKTIGSDASIVESDLSSLSSSVGQAKSDLTAFPSDLSRESTDVATTKSALAGTFRMTHEEVCYQAGLTQADAGRVQADVGSITADDDSLKSDLGYAATRISSLRSDWAKLRGARSALPSYAPAGMPSAVEVSSAIASARSTIAQIRTAFAGTIKRSNAMLKTANEYAARAQAVCNKVQG